MDKSTFLRTLESYTRQLFKNVSRNGDWINFSCPVAKYTPDHKFKEDNSPSFGAVLLPDGKVFCKCFTCKYQGTFPNLLKYLQTKNKNVSYSDIIQKFEENVIYPDYEARFQCSETKHDPLPVQADLFEDVERFAECSKYLADRGVSVTTARKLKLGYDPDQKRLVFPVKDQAGLIYGYTGRTIREVNKDNPKIRDYYFPKSQFILGMEHWQKGLPIIIVEGLFGFAHLHEISKGRYFPYNIGAIMGSSISDEQTKILLDYGSPVHALLDNDAAGKIGMFGKKAMPDWSKTKREMEKQKGLIFKLKDHIPTFVPRWPELENGEQKDDPDSLTYDELCAMLAELRLVL